MHPQGSQREVEVVLDLYDRRGTAAFCSVRVTLANDAIYLNEAGPY